MNKVNYHKEFLKTMERAGADSNLYLHACCAPCSSHVLDLLKGKTHITVFYYNPNITEELEYYKRKEELSRLIASMNDEYPGIEINFVPGNFEPEKFLEAAKGLEDVPEGGKRCEKCFFLRLKETALMAKEAGADFFTTTLTISPLKNAEKINEIGKQIEMETGVRYLPSDFKKNEGYKHSIELSKKYDLYRQDYCGCPFSKAESIKRRESKNIG